MGHTIRAAIDIVAIAPYHKKVTFWKWHRGAQKLFFSGSPRFFIGPSRPLYWNADISDPQFFQKNRISRIPKGVVVGSSNFWVFWKAENVLLRLCPTFMGLGATRWVGLSETNSHKKNREQKLAKSSNLKLTLAIFFVKMKLTLAIFFLKIVLSSNTKDHNYGVDCTCIFELLEQLIRWAYTFLYVG